MEIVSGEFKLVRLDRHVRLGDKSMILNVLLFSLIKRACAVIVMTIMFDVINLFLFGKRQERPENWNAC